MPLPDVIEIVPLEKPVRAEITVPGSKSITNRALILAALAQGEVTLEGALWSEDTQIMVECLQELGFMVDVRPDPDERSNRTITVYGQGGAVPPGGTEQQPMELYVGNAGTAARFLAAFVCLGKGVYRLHGVPRMHERPQGALFKALRELGYRVESEANNEKLPVRIWGGESSTGSSRRQEAPSGKVYNQRLLTSAATSGRRRSCTVSIEDSSQFASALLLCAKTGNWEIKVVGENAEESPYVAMALKLIDVFPSSGGKFRVEADASSGSYFWAAGWILPGGAWQRAGSAKRTSLRDVIRVAGNEQAAERYLEEMVACYSVVQVADWPESDWQIDARFVAYGLLPEQRKVIGIGKAASKADLVIVSRRSDLGDSIMMLITIAALNGDGRTFSFADLGRLRVQECERVIALRTELARCGAKVIEEGDTLTVHPSTLHGAEIETYNDHRMAMCFAILGLKVAGIKIKNPACVKKTFPDFFQKLAAPPPKGLGATIRNGKTGRILTGEELFAD